jgi:hypothetical protein
MPRYHVTIYGRDAAAMADLVRAYGVHPLAQTLQRRDAEFGVAAVVEEAAIAALTSAGYAVERHEDVDAAADTHLAEIGQGNRYADKERKLRS